MFESIKVRIIALEVLEIERGGFKYFRFEDSSSILDATLILFTPD